MISLTTIQSIPDFWGRCYRCGTECVTGGCVACRPHYYYVTIYTNRTNPITGKQEFLLDEVKQ